MCIRDRSSGGMNNVAACVFIPLLSNEAPALNDDGLEIDIVKGDFKITNANNTQINASKKTKITSGTGMDLEGASISLLTQLINLSTALKTFSGVLDQLGTTVQGPLTSGNYGVPVGVAAKALSTIVDQVKTNLTTFKG
jgi:hypothetical protein